MFHLLNHNLDISDFFGDVLRVFLANGLNQLRQFLREVVHLELQTVVFGTFQIQF